MFRLGVIDLGTNSTRLLIADAYEGGVHPLVKKAVTTRLGFRLDETGEICCESTEKTIKAIKEYKEIMKSYGVDESFAIATSAVRSCLNRDDVVNRISKEANIDVYVLDGEQEARIGYLGVKTIYRDDVPMLVVDIGGGSTELILGYQGRILYKKSIQVGCVRLTENFIKEYPVSSEVISKIEESIHEAFKETINEIRKMSDNPKVVSIGGTATTLSALKHGIERVENSLLTIEDINDLIEDFKTRDIVSMKKIDLIDEGRHDIILAGTILLKSILNMLGETKTYMTMRDSLEGIVFYRTNDI